MSITLDIVYQSNAETCFKPFDSYLWSKRVNGQCVIMVVFCRMNMWNKSADPTPLLLIEWYKKKQIEKEKKTTRVAKWQTKPIEKSTAKISQSVYMLFKRNIRSITKSIENNIANRIHIIFSLVDVCLAHSLCLSLSDTHAHTAENTLHIDETAYDVVRRAKLSCFYLHNYIATDKSNLHWARHS